MLAAKVALMAAKKASAKPRVSDTPWMASVAVVVEDRERSKAWYTEKLGMQILQDGEHWVTVGRKGKGGAIHLCLASELGSELEPGNSGILVMLEGPIKSECRKLKARGVEFVQEPTKQPWGAWDARVRDPDGNELLLMESD